MVLWENDGLVVNEISQKLILNTNTVTPLLKRMELMGILIRTRSETDERKVTVSLTPKGKEMREHAAEIPKKMAVSLTKNINPEDLVDLKNKLHEIIQFLIKK